MTSRMTPEVMANVNAVARRVSAKVVIKASREMEKRVIKTILGARETR